MFDDLNWYVQLGLNVVIAAVILIAAFWISGFAKKQIMRLGLKYEELDDTLFSFLSSLAKYAILAIAIVFVLSRFGIQTTSLVALLGAAGLAIGLALQGTLSNLAAGVMLLGFRPFKIGDYVDVGGHSGTVKAITLFTTEIATADNIQITIPNGDIWASSIRNFSFYDKRRCDLVIGVAYDTNLKKAKQALLKVVNADARTHQDPAPFVKVTNLGDSSVDFTIRAWVDAGDYFELKTDLLWNIKEELEAQGIEIPYPTSVHIGINGSD